MQISNSKFYPVKLLTEYPAKHFLRLFVLTYAYPRLFELVFFYLLLKFTYLNFTSHSYLKLKYGIKPPVTVLNLFQITFRLDEKVSTGITHLLKSPFSAHPKNGNIAVPLNPKIIDHFQLSQVPNIS